ncbi:MAG: excalibur calcium-binding domain-containing protein [Candidatus Nanopelagicales bacterium]
MRRGFYALDGDTIERGRLTVRVRGVDTPEYGQCGRDRARKFTARFIASGVAIVGRGGRDRYGRVLAYVRNARGRDLGTALLRRGLANARYDDTDGYDWHPLERRYERIDGRVPHVCGRLADSIAGPEPWRPASGPYPDCATADANGATPLRRGDAGFNPALDADGDGVACE